MYCLCTPCDMQVPRSRYSLGTTILRGIVAFPGAAFFAGCAKGALAVAFASFFNLSSRRRCAVCIPRILAGRGVRRRGICTCLSGVCAKPNHASGVKTPELPRLYGGDESPPFQQRRSPSHLVNVAQVFRPEAFHIRAVVLPPPPCVRFKRLGSKEPCHINATTCRPEGTALHSNRLAASIQSTTRRRVVVLKSAHLDD